jgi:hypothetical protein
MTAFLAAVGCVAQAESENAEVSSMLKMMRFINTPYKKHNSATVRYSG